MGDVFYLNKASRWHVVDRTLATANIVAAASNILRVSYTEASACCGVTIVALLLFHRSRLSTLLLDLDGYIFWHTMWHCVPPTLYLCWLCVRPLFY
jgi:hypothetical protein